MQNRAAQFRAEQIRRSRNNLAEYALNKLNTDNFANIKQTKAIEGGPDKINCTICLLELKDSDMVTAM